MTSSSKGRLRKGYSWLLTLLFTFLLSHLTAVPARSQSTVQCVADRGGVIDGAVNPVSPSRIEIDGNCTIRNFPASNPLTSNISFFGNNPTSWLVIFDNVVFTGNMSCNLNSQGNILWFTNGSTNSLKQSCLNLLVAVEKINKMNPPGPPAVNIGVPFTYKLIIPVLFDPASGTVINSSGSPNDLHDITIWDDLNATGVDLTYLDHTAYLLRTGAPISHTFSNAGNALTFGGFPVVTAGDQIVIELKLVLNDNPTVNVPGKQFVNTAKWQFGRLINGVFHEPLPGEWGVSPPLTIAAPVLTLTKTGPATMNLGQWGNFGLDIRNTGTSDAWNTGIRDLLPHLATGGMCDLTPDILSAQVFAADGVTPVPGKGPLAAGSDYSLVYSSAPSCQLSITMLTAAGTIGPNQRLIIRYRTKLDSNTQNGVALTNIAGAIQWFNGNSSNANRKAFNRTLTNGTPGVLDHEDAFTVTTAITGYFFDKIVADMTTGVNPAKTAAPGDRLRYTLRFRSPGGALSNIRIFDEMDAMNAQAAFAPGTLTLVASPAGADISGVNGSGGAKGTGVIDVRNVNVPANGEAVVQFDITLKSGIANNTVVTDQATALRSDNTALALSDDPNVNGTADPNISGDEDPTRVTIASAPLFRVQKISADITGDPAVLLPGDTLRYTITVKNIGNADAVNVMLRDAIPANTTYATGSTTLNGVAVPDVAGGSPLVNGMRINSPANATQGLMPADASTNPANVATITFNVVVNLNAVEGTVISNQGFVSTTGIADTPSDDPRTPAPNDPTRDIVGGTTPVLVVTKSGPATLNLGQWGAFGIDIRNTGTGDAWNANIRDMLPRSATGGMCDLTPQILSAQVFAADGVTAVAGKGPLNSGSDYSLTYTAAPGCQLNMTMLTAAGAISPNQRLIIRYRTQLDGNTQNNVALTNVAGAIQWFNGDSSNANRKTYNRTLTNGTPGFLDHEDAFTVTAALTGFFFDKTVADLTSAANPAKTAAPGDKLRYTLRFRTTGQALNNFRIFDEMDAMNAQAAFVPSSLAIVSSPSGADISATNGAGGAKGTGFIDVRNLNLPADSVAQIQFDITLKSGIANGTVVSDQAMALRSDGTTAALSDDPNVNGTADPNVANDEDPTRVTIMSAPLFRVQKISADMTGDPTVLLPGDTLRYTLTVKNIGTADGVNVVLRDAMPANTTYAAGSTTLNGVAVADIAGASALINGMLINSPAKATPGLMPADASTNPANVATITFSVVVNANAIEGTVISNQGFVSTTGIPDTPSDDPRTPAPNDPTRDIVGGTTPVLVVTKSGPATMNLGQWGSFSIDIRNTGNGEAWNAGIRDVLPRSATGGMCDLAPEILGAQVFAADGVTAVAGKGALNPGSDYSLTYSAAPACQLNITMLTAAAAIGANQRLIIHYRTQLDSNTQNNVALTNVAGAIQWFNGDSSNANRKSYARTLTNGTPGILDHEDAHTVTSAVAGYFFDKTVANLTSGVNPAKTAKPGDKLRYTLRFRTTSQALSNIRIFDEMDAMNAQAAFVSGTLALVASPAGADVSATNGAGGAKGTGIIDIRNVNLPVNGEALIQFDITLKLGIADGTVVSDQATAFRSDGATLALSDDPNVNGTADPTVANDEDPTRLTIGAVPLFTVQKISADRTGDPALLLPGDTLRYTITVKNVGTGDAVNVMLRDATPANTAYVANTTTLNGAAVADISGASPLAGGMRINSPANATGVMPADTSSNPANVATITFDVVVDSKAAKGTVISNQGFVSAAGIADTPSDDPRTPAPNDPTRDIVGGQSVLFAGMPVALAVDKGSPGIVDPGDVLRYTITVNNSAAAPSTGVVLTDPIPANTTYVANSTLLNGLPVRQPDGGVSPLVSGISISSSNLTPPLPSPGAGTISPGATAVIQYEVRVNDGTPAGTVISNQGVVSSADQANLLTDGDGNPANGPEPTFIVVGAGQQLSISNQVSVVGGGAPLPGAQLEYVVTVTNVAPVPAYNVVITDDLNGSQPGWLGYVNPSATMNGSAAGITFAGSTITANYSAGNGPLAAGGVVELRFRTTLNTNLVLGKVVTNTSVVTWNDPIQTESASVSITVGGGTGSVGFAALNGSVWHDANFDAVQDSNERPLAGWAVELYQDDQLSKSVQTDANGAYSIVGVLPNNVNGVRYELRFRAPGAGANTAMLGLAVSPFTNGMQRITDIVAASGANLVGLSLPIHPNGVIYDSAARTPVAGATLSLMDARSRSPLPVGCFNDAAQQGQITLADGYYKFDINFGDPACPSGGDYLIGVTGPRGTNYAASQIIRPASDASTAAFSVPACPGSPYDAVPSTPLFCEVQPSEFAPPASVQPRTAGTVYHVHVMLDGSQAPGSSQIFNNHIPLDQQISGLISLSKTTPARNVTRGQMVPYTITVNNRAGQMLTGVTVVDRLPAGFNYVKGSALVDGKPAEPALGSRELSWNNLAIAGEQGLTVKVLVNVGAGVSEGEYVNRAQAMNTLTGNAMSSEATATVRVAPDPTFDCTDVLGKVFNDANRNGRQDAGEEGLAGVRVVTPQGLAATTDQHGRYHMTCAVIPDENRGSNFVMKLDDRTLPSGFRASMNQLQIKRATRGKALTMNFAASIHRVVGIDFSDAAFEPGKTEIRIQWRPRLTMLLEELRKGPAILRLAYVADIEDAGLVKQRVQAVKRQLIDEWGPAKGSYALTIEHEVFWRRGGPPKQPNARVPGSK